MPSLRGMASLEHRIKECNREKHISAEDAS
jgi:hypothetical protein